MQAGEAIQIIMPSVVRPACENSTHSPGPVE